MGRQSYLNLLILCMVLSQGIVISSGENIEVSSKIHSRQKRIINPGGNQQPHQQQVEPLPPNYLEVTLVVNNQAVGFGRLRRPYTIFADAHIVYHYGLQIRVSIRDPATGICYNNLGVERCILPIDFDPRNQNNHNNNAVLILRDRPLFLRFQALIITCPGKVSFRNGQAILFESPNSLYDLSQGIVISSGKNIEVSSQIHSRQKRIINPGGNQQPPPQPHQQQLEPHFPNYDQARLTVDGQTVGYGRLRPPYSIETSAHIVSHFGLRLRVSIRDPATGIRYNNLRIERYNLPLDFDFRNPNQYYVAVLVLRDRPPFLRVPPTRRNH